MSTKLYSEQLAFVSTWPDDLWCGLRKWVTDITTNQWRVYRTCVTSTICDAFCRETSQIWFYISDASRNNVSHSLSVMRLIHQRHQYIHISVTHHTNTRHKFYQWHVFYSRVTDMMLLVTRLVPGAWATASQWRVSSTRVTDRLLVTCFVSESRIAASLKSFSGIVSTCG
jgi:hypothetical protein